MDPLRIVVRVAASYVFALILTRISGHRTVKHADVPTFVVAVIIGDMFDDFFWGEVPAAQFVVGVGTLFLIQVSLKVTSAKAGMRAWRGGA
ncbi:MAG TPA: hypothetical protein VNJ03_01675 [Vicinamibacterales bacterium]|nr:hypothetical protein [Vicinamibacterales bacterium]